MGSFVKRIAILGSTGSIGRQTLDVVRAHPNRFKVVGLTAGANIELLKKQIEEFQPKLVAVGSATEGLHCDGCEILSLEEIASHPEVDLMVMAISGKAGLSPSLTAIRARKNIALSTKEVLIMAGEIVTAEAKQHGVPILPIDSEPSAIWQCLRGEEKSIGRLILTASGGPFRKLTGEELAESLLNRRSTILPGTWAKE
jgi:1-deoxy-D-xylulose-5-phosphate reductoisomerase